MAITGNHTSLALVAIAGNHTSLALVAIAGNYTPLTLVAIAGNYTPLALVAIAGNHTSLALVAIAGNHTSLALVAIAGNYTPLLEGFFGDNIGTLRKRYWLDNGGSSDVNMEAIECCFGIALFEKMAWTWCSLYTSALGSSCGDSGSDIPLQSTLVQLRWAPARMLRQIGSVDTLRQWYFVTGWRVRC
jgi:hypothetical protein